MEPNASTSKRQWRDAKSIRKFISSLYMTTFGYYPVSQYPVTKLNSDSNNQVPLTSLEILSQQDIFYFLMSLWVVIWTSYDYSRCHLSKLIATHHFWSKYMWPEWSNLPVPNSFVWQQIDVHWNSKYVKPLHWNFTHLWLPLLRIFS